MNEKENIRQYLGSLLIDGYPRNWVMAIAYLAINYDGVYELLEMYYWVDCSDNERLEIIKDLIELREETKFKENWEKDIKYLFKRN